MPEINFSTFSDEDLYVPFGKDINPDAFTELVRRHGPNVKRKCLEQLNDEDHANDVSQEVFLRLLTKPHTYKAGLPFKPWLNTIINNRCHDHLRQDKTALHDEVSFKILDMVEVEVEVDTEEVNRPTIEILRKLMEQLSGEAKLILLLKYEQGWSIKTIQESLGLEESAVKQRLKRSRDKLQVLLEKYSDAS